MDLYIPKMSDTPAITIPGLADNFNKLNSEVKDIRDTFDQEVQDIRGVLDNLFVEEGELLDE